MSNIAWVSESPPEEALEEQSSALRGKGCLVKIRPMDIDGGLIRVSDNGFMIGRDDSCGFVARDLSVSRFHANIEQCGETYIITDLNSTNGTFVNEERVTTRELKPGDRVRLANHIFKFLWSDHIEAQYHETVYSMVTKDGLTGVHNKRYFLETLDREIERAKRYGRCLALLLLDIDNFKQINDERGHLAGDEVLQELCRRVASVMRRDEVFARYGGEEFAMVMAETTPEGALQVAERVRRVVDDKLFTASNVEFSVTVSVGVAVTGPESHLERAALIEAADNKLYQAKQAGRNQVCC